MIYDTSVKNPKTKEAIENAVGKPASLWERIKSGGTGCRRMTVKECSPDIWKLIETHPGTHFSSMEIRPKGIIVFFKNNLTSYSWPIPFYRLSLYKSDTFSIHGEGSFVKYKMDSNFDANMKFIEKVKALKLPFQEHLEY